MTKRKYAPVWEKLKANGECRVKCSALDMNTVVEGVKQEKSKDKNKPNGKMLSIKYNEHYNEEEKKINIEIHFKLVEDVSIRNL